MTAHRLPLPLAFDEVESMQNAELIRLHDEKNIGSECLYR
jgi:hypothetical protein